MQVTTHTSRNYFNTGFKLRNTKTVVQPADAPSRDSFEAASITTNSIQDKLEDLAGRSLIFLMDRRIPTTVPEITPDKATQLTTLLKPGDIILTADCAYPGWATLGYLTARANHTHAAFYGGDGKIYEATGQGVTASDLKGYFEGRIKVAIVRPPYKNPTEDVQTAVAWCKQQVGKPYDNVFAIDDDKAFYCSELVYGALKHAQHPIEAPSKDLFGKKYVSVDSFEQIPGATIIYDDGSKYGKNLLAHWPVLIGTGAGAALGGSMAGAGGAILGGIAGLIGTIGIGNKIQTGEWFPD